MIIYYPVIGIISGVCLAFGLLYFFIALRRKTDRRVTLFFALFALGYGGTLMLGLAFRQQNTVDDYLRIVRFDGLFQVPAFVMLAWYIAEYTDVKPRAFLWSVSAIMGALGIMVVFFPTSLFVGMPQVTYVAFLWGEEIADLSGQPSSVLTIFSLGRLVVLGYIVVALIVQFRRGARRPALMLGIGLLWFLFSMFYEILGESKIIAFFPLAETGFLGIAIAAGLSMADAEIRTEAELERYRSHLEELVDERTRALAEAQSQLLDQERAAAVNDERARIARDLHDAVTQTLYSATLIAEALPQVWARDPQLGMGNLTKVRLLVRGALAEMRILLFELRPDALRAASMESLLYQLADIFTSQTRLPVTVSVDDDDDDDDDMLPADVKIAIFRMIQESVNNAAKHAAASELTISATSQGRRFTAIVEDNGIGFDPATTPQDRMGLNNIRERGAEVGALVTIESAPGQGTRVTAYWPEHITR